MSIFYKTKKYLIDLLIKNYSVNSLLPQAIIMDVDDTLVDTSFSDVQFTKINNEDIFLYPGIQPMIDVAQTASKLGYKIIILTARPNQSFLSTKFNLDLLEVPHHEIYMNNNNKSISFKYKIREQLLKKYNILFTVGDQVGDVNGPRGLLGVKLPSAGSYKVQIYSN